MPEDKDTRGRSKKWIISDDVYISGDPRQQLLTLQAGDAAIEIDGKNGEIILSGVISKMSGGSESDEIIFQEQPLMTKIVPSTVMTPIPGVMFRLPFKRIAGLVTDVIAMASYLA